MLSEEKKTIESLKTEYEKLIKEDNILFPLYKSEAKRLIDLIEKQSKEIEEYKKQLDLDYVDEHFVPIERYNQLKKEIEELKDKNKKLQDKAKELIFEKQELTSALLDSTPNDKIKATIEELDENGYWDFLEKRDEEKCKDILQSLLEKE